MREYIISHGDFRFIINKYYFDESSRSSLPGVLFNLYLDTTICDRWPQSISIEHREIWNRKGCDRTTCPFCVRIAFDRVVRGYIVKVCMFLTWVMLSTYRLLLVMLSLKLIYLLRREVSWLILVKLVTPVYSLRLRFAVCFPIGPMT